MKTAGQFVLFIAFLGGAYLTALDPRHMNWLAFVPVMSAAMMGLLIYKRAEHEEAKSDHRLSADRQLLADSLDNILTKLVALDGRKDQIPTYDMRFEIDRMLRDDLANFADARESIKHLYGIRAYADIMSSFAAGERYINRVWSASTDGYVDEVLMYVEKSLSQFKEAKQVFEKYAVDDSGETEEAATP